MNKRTAEEWDALNAHEAEAKQFRELLRTLGHQPVLTTQERFGLDDRIPRDFKVWVSCTCMMWMPRHWFSTVEAAVEAHTTQHKPGGEQ